MYKVFIYDKPVYLTSNAGFEVKNCQQLEGVDVNKILLIAEQPEVQGLVVKVRNLESAWKQFNMYFQSITAGGGVVLNSKQELLLIHRLGKWDLPKGKLEKGEKKRECAIREVEEECMVSGLSIVSKLLKTYHCYPYKGAWALKTTHWYLMQTNYSGALQAQTEEGITAVQWMKTNELSAVFSNTYQSIIEVLNASGYSEVKV